MLLSIELSRERIRDMERWIADQRLPDRRLVNLQSIVRGDARRRRVRRSIGVVMIRLGHVLAKS